MTGHRSGDSLLRRRGLGAPDPAAQDFTPPAPLRRPLIWSIEMTREKAQRKRLLFDEERLGVTAGRELDRAVREHTRELLDTRVERVIGTRRDPYGDPH